MMETFYEQPALTDRELTPEQPLTLLKQYGIFLVAKQRNSFVLVRGPSGLPGGPFFCWTQEQFSAVRRAWPERKCLLP